MEGYIELQFGQITEIQREIIPTSCIETVYVELPEAVNIVFVWRRDNKVFQRTEYYPDKIQCNRRWKQIERILQVNVLSRMEGNPIPMDRNQWNKLSQEAQTEYRKDMIRHLHYQKDDVT